MPSTITKNMHCASRSCSGQRRLIFQALPYELRDLIFTKALTALDNRPIGLRQISRETISAVEELGVNVNLLRACFQSKQLVSEALKAFYRANIFRIWDMDIPRFLARGIDFFGSPKRNAIVTAWLTQIHIVAAVDSSTRRIQASVVIQLLLGCPRLQCVQIRLTTTRGTASKVTAIRAKEIRSLCRRLRKKAREKFKIYV